VLWSILPRSILYNVGPKDARMDSPPDPDLTSAVGLALAVVAALIERDGRVPKGEVARCLALLAENASPRRPGQREILEAWTALVSRSPSRMNS